jgi:hypothetical protein
VKWRIYYSGDATFDDSQGSPADAPPLGVLSIRQRLDCQHHPSEWLKPEQPGISPIEMAEWYWWREDEQAWFRGNLVGFLDQAMHCGAQYLKAGRAVSHAEWERTLAKVSNDADFA